MSAAAAEVPIVAGVHHVVDAHLWGLGIILELLGTIFNVAGKQCIRHRPNLWQDCILVLRA